MPSYADISENTLEDFEGWTLISVKTVSGFIDEDGTEDSAFEGCDYERTIMFTDGTQVKCDSYGYQYSFMPKAFIFGRSYSYKGSSLTSFKMIVAGEDYDLQ
ncbi:hypothetical protein D1Z90_12095 [Motilimonas pumila]|uniref:Uncharacterized protein n=2 Tax=Motilimonas pumila TaxID=2303987 RepID=A0A418YDT3_9GAMM|nr:hypothetical protein D1Z90_12095 [Motilimonas pumila]